MNQKINTEINLEQDLNGLNAIKKGPIIKERLFPNQFLITNSSYNFIDSDTFFTTKDLEAYKTVFLESDAITSGIENTYGDLLQTNINPNFDPSSELINALSDRNQVIDEQCLQTGNNLVIFIQGKPEFDIQKNILESKYKLDVTQYTHIYEAYPDYKYHDKVSLSGWLKYENISSEILDKLEYRATLDNQKIIPLFSSQKSNKVVGGYLEYQSGGIILFAPTYRKNDDFLTGSQGGFAKYLACLDKICDEIRLRRTVQEPTWLKGYKLPNEVKINEDINSAKHMIIELEAKLKELDYKLSLETKWKKLIFAQGDILENIVKEFFEEIGCNIVKGPKGEVDFLLEHNSDIITIEVKSSHKGCSKANIRQAIDWVNATAQAYEMPASERNQKNKNYIKCLKKLGLDIESFDDNSKDPKCLIIFNGFCGVDPKQRESCYSNQNINHLIENSVCAVTTIQLLNILVEFNEEKLSKEEIVYKLYNTKGILEGYDSLKHISCA